MATIKLSGLLLRTLIWGLAGALCGGVYAGLSAYWQLGNEASWLTTTMATAVAGTITAAFFGSMLVAFMATMLGVLAAIAFLVVFGDDGVMAALLVTAAGIAFLAGTTLPKAETLRVRPLGQTVSGLLAGIVAGPVIAVLTALILPAPDISVAAGIAVVCIGLLFLVFSRGVTPACPDWLSTRYSAPVVASVVATAVAAGLWLVGSSITGGAIAPREVEAALAVIPGGMVGGAIGGACGGAGLELFGVPRQDYHV